MEQVSRFFFGLCSFLFLVFAYWQWNDPDPVIWVSIYVFAALLSALAAFGRFPLTLLLVFAFCCLLGSFYFFPASVSEWVSQEWQQQDLSMKTLAMEEARESFGLLIISGIMSLAALVAWRKKRNTSITQARV